MPAFEQKEKIPDKKYQYLLFAADPYDTIALKNPNMEIDHGEGIEFFFNSILMLFVGKFNWLWGKSKKVYTLTLTFKERHD